MAYHFKRYKIKWDLKTRRFKKIKKDRKKSREAYQRFMRNKGKMLAALRKNRKKIKRKAARNRNAGIQVKLAKARKRYKHLLNNSLEYTLDNVLFEAKEMEPEVSITERDLVEIDHTLSVIKGSVDFNSPEERDEFFQYIEDSRFLIQDVINRGDDASDKDDENAVSGILRFIETFYNDENKKKEKSNG